MDQKVQRQKPVKEFFGSIEGLLNNDIVFSNRQKYSVEFSDDTKSYEVLEKNRLQSNHRYKTRKYDKYRSIEQIGLKYNNKDVNGFLSQLRPKFQQGDPFVSFNENVLKYDSEQRKWLQSEILINKNEVTLIQLWDLEELTSIKELKNRIEEIDGTIRVLSISKLDGKRKAAKIIHNFNKCEHYLLDNEILPKTYPYSILINKYGNITFMGETIEFNLKKKIQTLLEHQVEEGQEEEVEEIEEIKYEEDEEQENTNYEKSIIEKERFQQLKQKLKQYLETVKQYNDKKTRVTLTLVKEQIFNKSWQLVERSNVLVDYKSPIEEQETLNSILDQAKDLFNDDLKIFSSIQYDQQKEWEGFRQKLEEFFENYGLDIPIYYIDQTQYKRTNNQIKQIKRFALSVPKNTLKYEIFKSIKKDIKLYVKYNIYDEVILDAAKQTYDNYLKRGYQLEFGDVLPDIEGFHLKDQDVSTIILQDKPSIILYFDPLDIDSKLQLQKVNQILQDNIQFIGLSNRIQQDTEEFINKNINVVEKLNIYYPESEYLQAFKQVEHNGYPYYIILDQNKRIRKIGKINNIQFIIDNILNSEIQEQYINNIDEIKQLYQSIKLDKINEDLQNAGQGKQFTFNLQFIDIYLSDKQGQPQQYQQSLSPQLNYFIRQDKLPILQEVLSWLYIVLPQNKFRIEEFISETFDIQIGQQCQLCQKELGDVPQYYQPYNNLSYCVECAESDNQEEIGILRYKVKDNLIYINGQNQLLQNIDKHRIGNNIILQEGIVGDQWHNIDCEGCDENTQGPRYVSISTNPGKINALDGYLDLCHSCFIRFKNKDQALLDEVTQQYPDFSFDAPLLRILFDQGYWIF